MTYEFGAQSSYGYGYNAEIGVLPPQPAYGSYTPGINYYPTSTIGVAPYAPILNPTPATGVKPMGYSYGYSGYIAHPYYTSGTVPDYVSVTPSNFTYGNPVAPAVEQGSTTAYNPYAPYTGSGVTVTPSAFQNPYAPYTGGYVPVTPQNPSTLPQYQSGGMPAGGGGGAPSGSGGGGGPQPQQQQKQQPPVQIQINTGTPMHPARRSGSGYTGGNTGAVYNPNRQSAGNNYGGAASYGGSGQGGQASAGYNAPSIVPYLLLGGLGIGAYMMLKKHHH